MDIIPPQVCWFQCPQGHWCPGPVLPLHPEQRQKTCQGSDHVHIQQISSRDIWKEVKIIKIIGKVQQQHLCHQLAVLSVDSCDSSDVLTVMQRLEELTVSQHEHVLVGHEHLKGIHSMLSHQLLHLSSYLQRRCKWAPAFFFYPGEFPCTKQRAQQFLYIFVSALFCWGLIVLYWWISRGRVNRRSVREVQEKPTVSWAGLTFNSLKPNMNYVFKHKDEGIQDPSCGLGTLGPHQVTPTCRA